MLRLRALCPQHPKKGILSYFVLFCQAVVQAMTDVVSLMRGMWWMEFTATQLVIG